MWLILRDILVQAQCRTPEDPNRPDRPITSQIKNRTKKKMTKGKEENDQRDEIKKEGRKKNSRVEPTETFTSTK